MKRTVNNPTRMTIGRMYGVGTCSRAQCGEAVLVTCPSSSCLSVVPDRTLNGPGKSVNPLAPAVGCRKGRDL